jgi:hypothetical protein
MRIPAKIVLFGDPKMEIFPCGDDDGGENPPKKVWDGDNILLPVPRRIRP